MREIITVVLIVSLLVGVMALFMGSAFYITENGIPTAKDAGKNFVVYFVVYFLRRNGSGRDSQNLTKNQNLHQNQDRRLNNAVKGEKMKAARVFHHDDPPCSARLVDGDCLECGFTPDMQSLQIRWYCPKCDVDLYAARLHINSRLKLGECPKCLEIYE